MVDIRTHKKIKLNKKRFSILLVIFIQIIASCQKDITEQPNWGTLIQEARLSFQLQTQSIKQLDNILSLNNEISIIKSKTPDWAKSKIKKISGGDAIIVPLKYTSNIRIRIGKNNESIPIDSLSYMILLKNKSNADQFDIKVITRIPEDVYWDNRNIKNKKFAGLILVEDWWGNPLKSIHIDEDGNIGILGKNSAKESSYNKTTASIKSNSYVAIPVCYETVWEITVYVEGLEPYVYYETTQYCTTEYIYYNDGSITGEFTGGGGGSPSGSTSGGASTTSSMSTFTNSIDYSNLKPCAKSIMDKLKGLSNNSVANIIQRFAQSPDQFGWKWTVASVPSLGADITAQTLWPVRYSNVKTEVSEEYLLTATRLSVARTLLHEAVHAYLNYHFIEDPTCARLSYGELVDKFILGSSQIANKTQHEILMSFKNDIEASLRQYANLVGFSVDDPYFFADMAWGGLEGTYSFKQLSPPVQTRIKNRLATEKMGQSVGGLQPLGGTTLCNLKPILEL